MSQELLQKQSLFNTRPKTGIPTSSLVVPGVRFQDILRYLVNHNTLKNEVKQHIKTEYGIFLSDNEKLPALWPYLEKKVFSRYVVSDLKGEYYRSVKKYDLSLFRLKDMRQKTTFQSLFSAPPFSQNIIDWNHAPLGFDLYFDSPYVKVQFDAKMGLSVHARQDIMKGTIITRYVGPELWVRGAQGDLPDLFKTHYCTLMKGDKVIAGLTCPIAGVGVGSFINSSRPQICAHNTEIHRDKLLSTIEIKATDDILCGDQLFLNYALVDDSLEIVTAQVLTNMSDIDFTSSNNLMQGEWYEFFVTLLDYNFLLFLPLVHLQKRSKQYTFHFLNV
jgi:hypothetical protein